MGTEGRLCPQTKRRASTHHPRRARGTGRKDADGHDLSTQGPSKAGTFLVQAAAGQMRLQVPKDAAPAVGAVCQPSCLALPRKAPIRLLP